MRILPIVFLVASLPTLVAGQVVPPPTGHGPILGIYTTDTITDTTAVSVTLDAVPVQVDLYVILSHPGTGTLDALEFRVEFAPELDAATILVDVWDGTGVFEYWSWPDVFVGWNEPRPVFDGHAWIIGMRLLIVDAVATGTLRLTPVPVPTIPGEMAFIGDGDLSVVHAMRPNSDDLDHANPVFRISAGVVAARSQSFSAVRALFR